MRRGERVVLAPMYAMPPATYAGPSPGPTNPLNSSPLSTRLPGNITMTPILMNLNYPCYVWCRVLYVRYSTLYIVQALIDYPLKLFSISNYLKHKGYIYGYVRKWQPLTGLCSCWAVVGNCPRWTFTQAITLVQTPTLFLIPNLLSSQGSRLERSVQNIRLGWLCWLSHTLRIILGHLSSRRCGMN